ncbi:AAA family ATPase [Microbispora bryophytorum]|uniref:AAA family ATPase n=1 Tax=Microbispora bryophytorum TaxID=1460882 RepID=UPI0033CD2382
MLWGRATDHALIDGLLDRARAGRSGVLVVGGDPGIGKTSLLAYAAECAQDMRVLRGVGIETEAEIPFASLHLLLGHGLDRLDALPEPQAAALRGAFGLAPVTNRLLVGLAVLSLLAELAEGGPLLCLIDDAQWLDQESAQALRFAAHRLHAEGIVMIFAARDGFDPSGLPVHRLSGIDAGSAASLLAHAAPGLAPGTRDRVIEESCGNPLALLELPRTDLPAYDRSPLPLPARIQQAYEARIAELPPDAQKALLVTALTDGGDPDVIVRAGRELGIAPTALGVAEKSGLVTIDGGRVTFTHPLMRAAAFRHGTYDLRLEIHAILARLLDHQPDRRAWHLAAAATGPDETATRALEQAARRARERDGNAGACAALERAAELTEDHALKAGRLAEAAVAAADAGQARRARELVEDAATLVDDPRSQRAAVRPARQDRVRRGRPPPGPRSALGGRGGADRAHERGGPRRAGAAGPDRGRTHADRRRAQRLAAQRPGQGRRGGRTPPQARPASGGRPRSRRPGGDRRGGAAAAGAGGGAPHHARHGRQGRRDRLRRAHVPDQRGLRRPARR